MKGIIGKVTYLFILITCIWFFVWSGSFVWLVVTVIVALVGHAIWGDKGDPNTSIFDDKNETL